MCSKYYCVKIVLLWSAQKYLISLEIVYKVILKSLEILL